jgi:hypothetical protein
MVPYSRPNRPWRRGPQRLQVIMQMIRCLDHWRIYRDRREVLQTMVPPQHQPITFTLFAAAGWYLGWKPVGGRSHGERKKWHFSPAGQFFLIQCHGRTKPVTGNFPGSPLQIPPCAADYYKSLQRTRQDLRNGIDIQDSWCSMTNLSRYFCIRSGT